MQSPRSATGACLGCGVEGRGSTVYCKLLQQQRKPLVDSCCIQRLARTVLYHKPCTNPFCFWLGGDRSSTLANVSLRYSTVLGGRKKKRTAHTLNKLLCRSYRYVGDVSGRLFPKANLMDVSCLSFRRAVRGHLAMDWVEERGRDIHDALDSNVATRVCFWKTSRPGDVVPQIKY